MRISDEGAQRLEDVVVRESPLTIYLNGQELVTLLCIPSHQKSLALGFLLSEGFLSKSDEIKSVVFYEEKGVVNVILDKDIRVQAGMFQKRTIPSGCGNGAVFYNAADRLQCQPVESGMRISPAAIRHLMRQVNRMSDLFRTTGGVHACALCRGKDILIFREDIGRHNAIDKILGESFLSGTFSEDAVMVTSGRLTSEMLIKVARQRIPVLVSRSAPTDLSVALAKQLNVTLIGFVRGSRMTVYSAPERLLPDV